MSVLQNGQNIQFTLSTYYINKTLNQLTRNTYIQLPYCFFQFVVVLDKLVRP